MIPFYHILTMHVLWAIYATARNARLNKDLGLPMHSICFLVNLLIAPIGMLVGIFYELRR